MPPEIQLIKYEFFIAHSVENKIKPHIFIYLF